MKGENPTGFGSYLLQHPGNCANTHVLPSQVLISIIAALLSTKARVFVLPAGTMFSARWMNEFANTRWIVSLQKSYIQTILKTRFEEYNNLVYHVGRPRTTASPANNRRFYKCTCIKSITSTHDC
jgi:hypothetical protein